MKMKEVRMVRTGKEERRGMAVVRLREGNKKKVMGKKKRLKGRSIWTEDDLKWEERRWLFKEVVMAKERRGARVWVGNGRMTVEGEWWFWDEREGMLKDRLGRRRGGKGQLGEGGKKAD